MGKKRDEETEEIILEGGVFVDPLDVIAASLGSVRAPDEVFELEGEDIGEMARSGVPKLMNRAYQLAMGSMDLKSVLSVLKEFADRGHGKVSDNLKLDVTVGIGAILKELEGTASGLPSQRDLEYLDILEGEDAVEIDVIDLVPVESEAEVETPVKNDELAVDADSEDDVL